MYFTVRHTFIENHKLVKYGTHSGIGKLGRTEGERNTERERQERQDVDTPTDEAAVE